MRHSYYVQKYYKQYAFHASRDAEFVLATLGNDAGIIGAAALVTRSEEKVILDKE